MSVTLLALKSTQPDYDARMVQVTPANLQAIADMVKEMNSYASSMQATWNNGYLRTVRIPVTANGPWDYVAHKQWLLYERGATAFRVLDSGIVPAEYTLVGDIP